MRRLLILATLFFASPVAGLPGNNTDGWHRWTVDVSGNREITVRLHAGVPTRIHISDWHCGPDPRGEITDHGPVSSSENFQWFRQFVEQKSLDNDVRGMALLGLAQSESDEAFDYLDAILGSNSP